MAVKYIIVALFVVVYIVWGRELGFTIQSPLWTHLTFSFQHASIIHLALNSLVFISAFRVMEKFMRPFSLLWVIFLIAFASSFASMADIPTVGSSGMIYAIFGMQTVIVVFNNATPKQKRLFFFAISLMLVASLINGGSSFMVHIVSFIFGALYWMIKRERDIFTDPSPKIN